MSRTHICTRRYNVLKVHAFYAWISLLMFHGLNRVIHTNSHDADDHFYTKFMPAKAMLHEMLTDASPHCSFICIHITSWVIPVLVLLCSLCLEICMHNSIRTECRYKIRYTLSKSQTWLTYTFIYNTNYITYIVLLESAIQAYINGIVSGMIWFELKMLFTDSIWCIFACFANNYLGMSLWKFLLRQSQ